MQSPGLLPGSKNALSVYITLERLFFYESVILDCIFARLDVSRGKKSIPNNNPKLIIGHMFGTIRVK